MNFHDELGVWRAIDTRVVADTTNGDYKVGAAPYKARFGGSTGSDTPLLVASGDDWSVGFKPLDLRAGRAAEVNGHTVTYPGVGPGTDLVFKAGNDRVKETIRLNEPLPLGQVPRWRSQLVLEGVTPLVDEKGSVVFVRPDNTRVAEIPVGVATDSSRRIDAAGLTPRTFVRPLLLPTDTGWVVELLVDQAWLASPERVYPAFVDPTVRFTEVRNDFPGADVVVGSGCGNCRYDGDGDLTSGGQTEGDMYVDKIGLETYTPPGTTATGNWEWRSLLFFDLGSLAGRGGLLSATLEAFYFDATSYPTEHYVRPIENAWNAHNVNWDSQPAVRSDSRLVNVQSNDYEASIDITSWMQN